MFHPTKQTVHRFFWLTGITFALLALTLSVYSATEFNLPGTRSIPSPAGSNSAEPHLSRGPGGAVVLSWLERESQGKNVSLRFSVLDGNNWQEASTIAEGENWFVNWADFPSVSPISSELWAAHWLVKKPGSSYAYDVAISISHDAGLSWSKPITPHTDNTATEHGFVSLFPAKNGVGALWLDGRNMTDEGHAANPETIHGGMTLRSALIASDLSVGSEYLLDDLVCDCCQTDVATGKNGPIAVYRNRTKGEIRDIYVSRMIAGQWQAGEAVGEDGWEIAACPVNGPSIAASGSDVAVAWFTMADDKPRVRLARSIDGAATFSSPVNIDSDQSTGRVDAALLDDGNAVVSWLRNGENGQGELVIRLVTKTGKPGPTMLVTQSSTARPAGFPQMVKKENTLVFAWTDTTGDEPRVQTAVIDLKDDFQQPVK
jgi:hypothetical protein